MRWCSSRESLASEERNRTVRREFNVLALIKGTERYVYIYDDESRAKLLDALRDQAADPNLSITWFDVAVLSDKAREQALQQTPETSRPRL
jgi:hypothetical protein